MDGYIVGLPYKQINLSYSLSEKDKPLLTQRRHGAKTQSFFYKTILLRRVFSFLLLVFLTCPQADHCLSEMQWQAQIKNFATLYLCDFALSFFG